METQKALKAFKEHFGDADVSVFSAPGRTEVGGNQTDHQHGEVLCAAVDLEALAVAAPCEGDFVHIYSEGYGMLEVSPSVSPECGTAESIIYGVLKEAEKRGFKTGAFNAYVISNVIGGSGLSSSAAFEILICTCISYLFNDGKIDAVTNAIIGQAAENNSFGKPCGLMDQMASSVGALCHIDFKDPSEPVFERISFDLDKAGYDLCITDVKASHADLTDEYAAIPDEMKKVAAFFGKSVLREINESDVFENIRALRKELGDRPVLRAIHFFEENKRVRRECEALKNGDMPAFLENVRLSGNSSFKFLQNVYLSSDPTLQAVSVALAVSETVLDEDGSYAGACRVHGGGFAGTIQAFVRKDKTEAYVSAMDSVFGKGSCLVLHIREAGGIKIM